MQHAGLQSFGARNLWEVEKCAVVKYIRNAARDANLRCNLQCLLTNYLLVTKLTMSLCV